MKALSKNAAEVNAPIAYFELNVSKPSSKGPSQPRDKQSVVFDMNRNEVQNILDQLTQIQETYEKIVNK
jgi:hypothetical protein